MDILRDLIKQQKWYLIYKSYIPQQILEKLSYKESMRLAFQIFTNKEDDSNLFNYAIDLFQNIRKKFPLDWASDWRNDFFLGDVCHFTMRFDERYEAYKRACLKFTPSNLPSSLLVSLARCYSAPGNPQISLEEAENLARAALEKEKSIEAVVLIRGICKKKGKEEEFLYWEKVLKELEQKQAYMKNEWPKWLIDDNKIT